MTIELSKRVIESLGWLHTRTLKDTCEILSGRNRYRYFRSIIDRIKPRDGIINDSRDSELIFFHGQVASWKDISIGAAYCSLVSLGICTSFKSAAQEAEQYRNNITPAPINSPAFVYRACFTFYFHFFFLSTFSIVLFQHLTRIFFIIIQRIIHGEFQMKRE